MNADIILGLIDEAIVTGKSGSLRLSDIYNDMDALLESSGKDALIRDFFDSWADAINHDYLVYKGRDPKEWVDAAVELRSWYQSEHIELTQRDIWRETVQRNAYLRTFRGSPVFFG